MKTNNPIKNESNIWTDTLPKNIYRWQISIDKWYSTSYVIRKIQIKTLMRYHCTPIKKAEIQKIDNNKCRQVWRATGIFIHCWWESKMVQPLWKTIWHFLFYKIYSYHIIQQSHSLEFTQRKWKLQFSPIQSLSRIRLFVTPWITARQPSLSITNSRSLLKLMSIESVMPSSHLILYWPLLLLPQIHPSIRVFSWVNSLLEVTKVLEF